MSKNLPFIIAEIGINHNGDIDLAKKLIDASKEAGCHAVKFQKKKSGCMRSGTPKESYERNTMGPYFLFRLQV